MRLTQNLVLSQRLEQILAPQQIQALEILLATIPEIEQKISEELAENPTLELLGTGSEQLVGNPVESDVATNGDVGDAAGEAAEKDEALATLMQLGEVWRDCAPTSYSSYTGTSPEDEERRQFLLDSLVEEPGLQDVLVAQLRQLDDVDARCREVCEQVIGSIDDTGYLRTHTSDIAIAATADVSEVRKALSIVQGFDPPGVGARDLRECLLLQLERKGKKGTLIYRVVDEYLDEIGRNQIPKVARALRVSSAQLYEVLEGIRKLNPHPGSLVTPAKAGDFVYPEAFIEGDNNGGWQVRLNRDYTPRLRISPYYLKVLEDPSTSKEVKSYIREKMANSKLLLRAIDQRQSTIEEIANSLLVFQRGFFDHGVEHMRPLVMSEVADDIGVHETTVSRAIANKYVQTPHGLFPFRHFFSTGYRADGGEMVSSHGIKQKLQALVSSEDPRKPLSDQKLAELLKEQGFKVARRTVAKYREEMDVLPSHMRRSF